MPIPPHGDNAHDVSKLSASSLIDALPKIKMTFERLPLELRRKIYSYVLVSHKVRQPPNKLLIRSYHFETAILLVNKKIYHEASCMLYNDNHFITISCDWDMIHTVMANHEVAVVCEKPKLVARFKRNIMRLHIRFPWAQHEQMQKNQLANKTKIKVLESFIILADDLPAFTRMLHIMNVTNGGDRQGTKYIFRIEQMDNNTTNRNLEKTLLEPFRYLYTKEGYVKIIGVDLDYAQDLGSTMMPPVHWVRDAAWRLYYVCVSIKEVADQALRMGNCDLAFAKYADAQNVYKTGAHNNPRIGDVEDEGFHKSCVRLLMVCEANILLVSLISSADPNENVTPSEAAQLVLKYADPTALVRMDESTAFEKAEKSRLYHYRGIALCMANKEKAAFISFRTALQLNPSDESIEADFSITRKRLAAKTSKERAAAGTVRASRLLNEPLELEPPVFTKSRFIAVERYLLRKHGYNGNMLEHIEGSVPLDMKEIDVIEKRTAQQLKGVKKDESLIKWIGGGGLPENQRSSLGEGFLQI